MGWLRKAEIKLDSKVMDKNFKDSIDKSLEFSKGFWEGPNYKSLWASVNDRVPWHFQKRWALYEQLDGVYESMSGLDILDFGCGNGSEIYFLLQLGADMQRIRGIDINENIIKEGKKINPTINIQPYSGESIPFSDNSFDFCYTFLVFSSILNSEHRKFLAQELIRVTKPGGRIFYFDLKHMVASHEHRKPLNMAELFPGLPMNTRDVPKYNRPSNGIRPLKGLKKYVAPFIDRLSYESHHISSLIGPVKK
jgi:SAM-dependent methyltransferase